MSIRPKWNFPEKKKKSAHNAKIQVCPNLSCFEELESPTGRPFKREHLRTTGRHCPRHRMLLFDKGISVSWGKMTASSSLCTREEQINLGLGSRGCKWNKCKSYKERESLLDALKPSSAPQTLTCKPITWGSWSSAHFGSMSQGMGMKFCFSTNTLPPHPEAVTGIRGPHGCQQGLQSDARWCGKQKWIFKLRGRASNPWKPPQLH